MPEIEYEALRTPEDAAETTAQADFAEDPAEEGQTAAPDASDAEDSPTAAEIESAALAKAAEIAKAEEAIAEARKAEEARKAAEAAAAAEAAKPDPEGVAEFGPKVHRVVETQDHLDHPSRRHPASRPCPAGPQN